jgi:segregation and condensation protein B
MIMEDKRHKHDPQQPPTAASDEAPRDSQNDAQADDEAAQVVVEDVQQEPDETKADPDQEPVDPTGAVEAVLFAADSALTPARIAQVTGILGAKAVKDIIAALNEKYGRGACAFRVEMIAGGFQMLTQPQYHEVLSRLYKARSETKLSAAAMETLSIVAYRQPILRADIEAIRGVASGEVLRGLMERQLLKIVGRAEVVGRPMLYGTTRKFLDTFGLAGLEDLPKAQELRTAWSEPEKPAAASPVEADPAATPGQPSAQQPPPSGAE